MRIRRTQKEREREREHKSPWLLARWFGSEEKAVGGKKGDVWWEI